MTDPSEECEAILADVRGLDAPPPGARELVRDRLTAKLGDVWDAPVQPALPSTTTSASMARTLRNYLLLGLAGGVLAIGAWHLERTRTSASEPVLVTHGAPVTPSAAEPVEGPSRPEPAVAVSIGVDALPSAAEPKAEKLPRTPVRAAAAPTREDARHDDASSLAEEARLVRSAHAALRRGDGTEALALLGEHERRFPQGVLRQERNGERVLVLCALGRRDEAKSLAKSFLRAEPASSLAERVRASCGGEP